MKHKYQIGEKIVVVTNELKDLSSVAIGDVFEITHIDTNKNNMYPIRAIAIKTKRVNIMLFSLSEIKPLIYHLFEEDI